MADRKITDLTALAAGSQATGDLLTIVDVSEVAAADKNKKITVESLFKGIPGNVGIGTSSPARGPLHINSSTADTYFHVTNSTTGSSASDGFTLHQSGNETLLNNRESGNMRFYTAGSERMRIDSSGHVKIPAGNFDLRVGDDIDANAGTQTISVGSVSSGSGGFQCFANPTNGQSYLQFGDGSASASQYRGYVGYKHADDALVIGTAGSERMRIDSSGNVGIGTTSPRSEFHVAGDLTITKSSNNPAIVFDEHSGSTDPKAQIQMDQENSTNASLLFFTEGSGTLSERMRITSSGDVTTTGTSTFSRANVGFTARNGDSVSITRNSGTPLEINRGTNDGNLVNFFQGGSIEGIISVSGSTVTYGGGHLARWSQLAGGAGRTEILRGSVLSNLDEMCEWGEEDNEQLNRMKISDLEGDVNVAGVFVRWDDDDDIYTNDFYCAMTGDFVIRIAQGTTVARGDLLMSAGDGTAKPQDDDIVRSKTIAKVTSTTVSTTYADGSYCVPCVLMAC